MSIYGVTPMATVYEDEIHAPFLNHDDESAERLMRMGITDERGDLREETVEILAAAFTVNFIDRIFEYCQDENETFNVIRASAKKLWGHKEYTGLYYYILLSCGMIEYPPPKELLWIVRNEDALRVYLQKFIETMETYTEEIE